MYKIVLRVYLAMRREFSSLCVLYCIYYGECSGGLFDLLPATEFSNRTVHHKLVSSSKYHPHHLDAWQSTTVQFRRNFLLRATQLWNGLPAEMFPS